MNHLIELEMKFSQDALASSEILFITLLMKVLKIASKFPGRILSSDHFI